MAEVISSPGPSNQNESAECIEEAEEEAVIAEVEATMRSEKASNNIASAGHRRSLPYIGDPMLLPRVVEV
jgi:hypothetical protein